MKNIRFNILLSAIALCTLCACNREDPMEKEQYIKQLYIVGAYQKVSSFEVKYSSIPQEAYVSVAISGTLFPDHDVTATLKHSNDAISAYNAKYMLDNEPVKYQMLPGENFTMESMSGTIKPGDVYTRIPLSIKSEGLHCDSLYALAFEIESVSHYEIEKLNPTLILNIAFENDYSGIFQFEAQKSNVTIIGEDVESDVELTNPSSLSSSRTLKAVDEKTIRVFHENTAEVRSGYSSNEAYWEGLKKNGIVFTRKGDSNEFDIKGWMTYSTNGEETGFEVLAGKAIFSDGAFTFWYDFKEGNTRKRIRGSYKK